MRPVRRRMSCFPRPRASRPVTPDVWVRRTHHVVQRSSTVKYACSASLSPVPDEAGPGIAVNDGADHPPRFLAYESRSFAMTIGPVQLIVLGFVQPDFRGHVLAELERLGGNDTIRVIDALIVYKHADGELEAEHLGNLSQSAVVELDSKIAALIGLEFDGEQGAAEGAGAGGRRDNLFGLLLDDEWDVIEDIPPNTAAALIMVEHHWAVPLRDAVLDAGGFRISDGFISPLDLVEIGLMAADEAKQMHELETKTAAVR